MLEELLGRALGLFQEFLIEWQRPSRRFAVNCFAPSDVPGKVTGNPDAKFKMQFGAVIGWGPTPEDAAVDFDKKWHGVS